MTSQEVHLAREAPPQLRSVFESHFGYVCQLHRRLGVPERDIEDAAQETFLAIHGKLDTYDPARPIRPWIFGFAYRIAANHRRKKTAEPDDTVDATAHAPETPEQRAAENQAKTLALKVLDLIPTERRDVFVMHEFEGFEPKEIAEQLSVPLNTVYSRLRVAREEFEHFGRKLVEPRDGR